MSNISVYMFSQDISQYVSSVDSAPIDVGEYGQITINEITTIQGNNINGFWDSLNPISPLFSIPDIQLVPIEIYNRDELVFDGYLLSVICDTGTRLATVSLRSKLTKALESGCIYVSTDDTISPARAAKEICLGYGIPFDAASYANSETIYNDQNVFCRVVAADPQVTVLDILTKLAEIGVARVFNVGNTLHFQAYRIRANATATAGFSDTATIGSEIIVTHVTVEDIEKEIANGFDVQWRFGNVLQQTIYSLKSISAGAESPVQISTYVSALWCGDTWLEYLNYRQQRVTLSARADVARMLIPGDILQIDYSRAGWSFIGEIVAIDRSNKLYSTITVNTI